MIVYGSFEWDVRQSAACVATHGVSFKEASTVFASDDVAISVDPASGRLRAIGASSRGRVLVVLHQRGARLRILGAELHTNRPAEALAPAVVEAPPAPAEAASPESCPSRNGWTAEAYGIYWEAYSEARQTARRQGKSHREAQRLGREAGERAMGGRMEPPSR
jgi:uncharacterized DUF497 family protein